MYSPIHELVSAMQVIDFSPGRTAKMKPVEKKTHRQLQYELARKERRLKTEACKRWRKRLKERLTKLPQEATQTLVAFELPEGYNFPFVSFFSAIFHV